MDLPLQMESDIVENEDGPGPYGAKGMSEGALLPVRAGRGSRRPDATGVVIRDLPLTPERVWRALQDADADAPRDLRLSPGRLHPGTLDEAKALVGGKAANLGVMSRDLGLPVPPGFAITTAACREFLATGWPAGLDDEIRARMADVEAAVGRRFGDPSDPLLVSVRSGAPVSMPGMMDTILNLGLNDATTLGLGRAAGSDAFAQAVGNASPQASVRSSAWPTSRRTLAAAALGDRSRLPFLEQRSGQGVSPKEGIPDDLGTAVTVQAMVFGNRGPYSATGVLFTRNPATGESTLYGDVMFDAQGDDVVAGTHQTEPIAVLDERMPAVAAELRDHATRLERHYADLCDIEFTIEDGRLWMLQVRVGKRSPQAALRMAVDMAEDESFPLSRAEAVERVSSLLAEPPEVATGRQRRGDAFDRRAAGLARSGERPDRHEPRSGRGCRQAKDAPRSSSVPRRPPTTCTAWPRRRGS